MTDYMVMAYLGIVGYREKFARIMLRDLEGQRSQAMRQPAGLFFFESLDSAEAARLKILGMGYPVGKYIMKYVYPDSRNLRTAIVTPACGWENVDNGEIGEAAESPGTMGVRIRFTKDPGQLKSGSGRSGQKAQEKAAPRKSAGKKKRVDGSGIEAQKELASRVSCTVLSREEHVHDKPEAMDYIDEWAAWKLEDGPRDPEGDQLTMDGTREE